MGRGLEEERLEAGEEVRRRWMWEGKWMGNEWAEVRSGGETRLGEKLEKKGDERRVVRK